MKLVETLIQGLDTRCHCSQPFHSPGFKSWLLTVLLVGANLSSFSLLVLAQTTSDEKNTPAPSAQAQPVQSAPSPVELRSLPRNIFLDQEQLVTTPFHLNAAQWEWTVPLGFIGAALVASDTAIEKHVPTNPSTVSHAVTASNAGLAAMAGIGGGMFLLGQFSNNDDQKRETGLLSGEAGIDALLDAEVLKYAFGRDRPFTGNGRGRFYQGGASFPSEHASISWAIASVIAHEYPGPLTQLLAYGLAGGVSAARIVGHQHFASDALLGSALGWYLGRQVFRTRSQYSPAEIARWGTFSKSEDVSRGAGNLGSPYVPLDSWVYQAMDRLTALGYVHSGFADMRPWTRLECARQLKEAADRIAQEESPAGEAERLQHSLAQEFARELLLLDGGDNAALRVESIYTRGTEIVGKPLTDGDHFGQTVINDFGRPEEQGFNDVSGISAWGEYGPLTVYARGEFQHSPAAAALPFTAREDISQADFGRSGLPMPFPVLPDTPVAAFNQTRFLDAYVALNLSDWQLSYGNQSLWWGPAQGGPLMFSDNAAPVRMFRVNRVTPLTLPGFLGLLGPMRLEAFVGQYSGYEFVNGPSGLVGEYDRSLNPQPIVHGERISFKPTSNLEIGFSRTTDYGGPGYPLTLHSFLRSVFSTGNTFAGNPNKPGSRRSGMDFSYRVPGLRDGMTFYAEGLAEHDEVTPLLGPDVASWLAGIYIPRLPRVSKLDFRVEGGYTDPPSSGGDVSHGAFYWDGTWITGFQNAGHLLGSWMGRQGQGAQAWTTYWLSPRNKIQLGFRHQKASNQLVNYNGTLAGGSLADANLRAEFWPQSTFSLSASVQYEMWNFPVIAPNRQSNVTSSLQFSFWPRGLSRKLSGN